MLKCLLFVIWFSKFGCAQLTKEDLQELFNAEKYEEIMKKYYLRYHTIQWQCMLWGYSINTVL